MRFRLALICLLVVSGCSDSRGASSSATAGLLGSSPGSPSVGSSAPGSPASSPTRGPGPATATAHVTASPSRPPCPLPSGKGGSTSQFTEFRGSGTSWLESGGDRETYEVPSTFKLYRIENRFSLDTMGRPYFGFGFEITPDGRLADITVSRPYSNGGSTTVGFRVRQPFDWQHGLTALTTETCSDGYRVTMRRPAPGTWDLEMTPAPGADLSDDSYTKARMTVKTGEQVLPDRWRAVEISVDARTRDAHYVFEANLHRVE